MGYFLMERIFQSTSNRVLTTHIDQVAARCVTEAFSTTCAAHTTYTQIMNIRIIYKYACAIAVNQLQLEVFRPVTSTVVAKEVFVHENVLGLKYDSISF